MKIAIRQNPYNKVECMTEYEFEGHSLFIGGYDKTLFWHAEYNPLKDRNANKNTDIIESEPVELPSIREMYRWSKFTLGSITVQCVSLNHAAFRIEADGVSVLHIAARGPFPPQLAINKCKSKMDYVVCDGAMKEFGKVLSQVSPRAVIPVNMPNSVSFAYSYYNHWPVIILSEGDSISPVNSQYFGTDKVEAKAVTTLNKEDEVYLDSKTTMKCYSSDNRTLGFFSYTDEADFVMRHTMFAPNRLLGFEIVSGEVDKPACDIVYSIDFKVLAEFPCCINDPDVIEYKPGDKVLAMGIVGNAVVPCEIIRPADDEYWKILHEEHNKENLKKLSFEEWKDEFLWDWDREQMLVKPLVPIKDEYEEKRITICSVPRVDIFPYIYD